MSVGRRTGFPARIASMTSGTAPPSLDDSLHPGQVGRDPNVVVAQRLERRARPRGACPSPTSSTSHVVLGRARPAPRAGRAPTSASRGSQSRTSGCERRSSSCVRRTAGSRRRGPSPPPPPRSRPRAARPRARAARAFSRASASASGETSTAVTCAPGCSSAIASAIAPEPTPTSSTRGAVEVREQREAPLDDDLRLGPRHERARVGAQRQPPEAPLAEDVGERLAGAAAARAARRTCASSSSSSGRSNSV